MASSFGGTVKLTGESEYRKALRDITTNLKEVSSELKLTNTQFSSGDKTVKDTKIAYNNMNTTMQEQKSKITELKTLISQMTKEYNEHQNKLIQVEEQYGKNSKEASEYRTKLGNTENQLKTFKTQLNNAETQLIQMENATDKSNKELKEMKNGFDDAGQGALKFGDLLKANVLGDFITSGLKAVGNGIKQIGSTFLNVGKQALDSYADYEQLVGGVETLFKESAGIVEGYANNAYKTAGLSANEYMETVTSFSASLLSSLNGDTAKSAKVADMAITDMSDNANKMGTDIFMIQSAYQGFAKQNYTMLDNLKLGYGGTKSEMERLLKDAQKISGVKYDISNLNDVYNAIHVIQGELGITGTTAKEASTTIQGSVSAMKSAWQNMLTGIADDNADFEGLVGNLVESIGIAAENIMPRVKIIIDGIVALLPQLTKKIIEHLPEIMDAGSEIITQLIDSLTTFAPDVGYSAFYIIESLLTGILNNLPTIMQAGIELLTELINGISQTLPNLIPVAINSLITLTTTILDNIDLIINSGIELILALAEGLINALPQLIDKIPVIIEKLIMAITNNLPKIVEMGVTLIIKLAVGLIKAIPQLISKIPQIISSLVRGFANYFSNMHDVGKNLVSGIWEGIKNAKDWLLGKIKEWCGNILNGIKAFFGIHSPSKVFKDEIGTNLALGVGEGFSDKMKAVSNDMSASIPKEFDVNSTVTKVDASSQLTLENITGAFVTAVKNLNAQVIIDKDVAGRFVITSVNSKFGEVM
jgi:phage-related protein